MKVSEAQAAIRQAEYWGPPRLASGHTYRTATIEELDALIQALRAEKAAAEKRAAEATQFRPDYAPARRLTRSESERRIVVKVVTEQLNASIAARLLAKNNISRWPIVP